MGSYGDDERAEIDEDHRSAGIRQKKAKVDAGELKSEHKAYHHPVEEHDIGVKQLLLLPQAIDDAAKGCDDGPKGRCKNGGYALIGDFDSRVVETPEQGQDNNGRDGTEIKVVLAGRCGHSLLSLSVC